MNDYPRMISEKNLIQPVPRRIRGFVGADMVFDTTRAIYVWEWSNYPQYYIPVADLTAGVLFDEEHEKHASRGSFVRQSLTIGNREIPAAAKTYSGDLLEGLDGMVRFEWDALDSWFEEDEEVFVHPRSPYARVDAIRSTRTIRVEVDGIVLAESSSPVMVFETGLPTRYYLNRTDVNFEHLVPSDTVSECPYKGTTGDYWSVQSGSTLHADLAWSYTFPTRQLLPITGLVAFYDEKVDTFIDGIAVPRPETHFFAAAASPTTR